MPQGVTALYFIQAFSTFSYAVLYSSLPLYITKQLHMSHALSNTVVGLFLAFNYILQLVGGFIGGRFLSNRLLFFITLIIQSLGILFLALTETSFLYIGLSLFLVGCGLNTTCYNNILTQRFMPDDSRRENAFFLSYAAMNIGFCAGYIASGFFDFSNQYQSLFYACLMTNSITLFLLTKSWSYLKDYNTPLIHHKNHSLLKQCFGLFLTLLLFPIMLLCFHSASFSNVLVIGLGILMFFVVITLGMQQKNRSDRQRINAYLILALSTLLFWMIFLTGPMGITLFIKNNVDKKIFGIELATQWVKNINPLAIIIGAPIMVALINRLKLKGYTLAVTTQFMTAFLFLALSFIFLSCGIMFSNDQGYSSLAWVIGYIIMQGLAELLIAPVGYAMIGRLAPPHLQGILMGSWMLVTGIASSLSQYFSNAMVQTESINPLITNTDFLHVFKQLSIWAMLGFLFLYFVSKRMNQMITNEELVEARISAA